jgi:hypothetical protein
MFSKIFKNLNQNPSNAAPEETTTAEIGTEEVIEAEFETEIIDKEDPIVPGGFIKYIGEIVSAHDGYSYIGRVKKGYETIATNGDVFLPQQFAVGILVEFNELNTDPKRPGKFRTEKAEEINGAVVLGKESERAIALRTLTARSTYHAGAKDIDPEKVVKAAENMPFAELLGIHTQPAEDRTIDISDMAKEFLSETFANLASIGVSYSVNDDVDKEAENKKVEDAIVVYRNAGLDGQVQSVKNEYRSLTGVRNAFSLMNTNGILSMHTVIPVKYLPDLLVTAPVWFISSREGLTDLTGENDPKPDHAVKYFCDEVGTKEFAWLYQIYNRRTRPLKQFDGRDIIPLPLMQIIEQAKNVFDYTVIATPYHDIASREWTDPKWLRNLDPFLFGFMKNLPYMFLLGRWSGTGLFPLMLDMIADTIDHLRLNKQKLRNFSNNPYWYKGGVRGNLDCLDSGNLVAFADEVIKAYDENRLFEFLRGETATNAVTTTN